MHKAERVVVSGILRIDNSRPSPSLASQQRCEDCKLGSYTEYTSN